MKNTTFRKKALLSSVAMLLVALVALGSATFAWFAANPNASAQGLSLKTTASTGLVIKTETDNVVWRHDSVLNCDPDKKSTVDVLGTTKATAFNLTPVSQDQTTPANFYTADAKLASAYETDQTPTSASGGWYAEKIYCRLSDGSAADDAKKVYLTGVTLTKNASATMHNAIRVAIAGPSGLIGTYAMASTGAHGVLTPTAGDFSPAITSIGTGKTDLKVNTGLTGLSASADDESKYITVYVYLDGQDTDCYSDKVGTANASQIISSLQINLTLGD